MHLMVLILCVSANIYADEYYLCCCYCCYYCCPYYCFLVNKVLFIVFSFYLLAVAVAVLGVDVGIPVTLPEWAVVSSAFK